MSDNKSPWGPRGGSGNNGNNNGGKSPWGNGGRPDRGRPSANDKSSDLENVIQGFKSRANRGGSGGPSFGGPNSPLGKFGPLGIVVGIGLILMISTSIYTVDQQEEAVVLRFGKYSRTAPPGLNFKFPAPFETYQKVKTKVVQKTEIGGNDNTSLMLTGDENIVDIDFTVLWRISDLKDFVFEVDEPAVALRAVAESAMREKADAPDGRVVDAFRDVVDANQEKETLINEATAFQNTVVPQARGDAAKILQDAEGYKGKVVAEAKGEAERFNLVLGEYQAAPRVTRQRIYLETIEQVYGPAEKIILDTEAGSGVVPYLPLDQLNKKKGAN